MCIRAVATSDAVQPAEVFGYDYKTLYHYDCYHLLLLQGAYAKWGKHNGYARAVMNILHKACYSPIPLLPMPFLTLPHCFSYADELY